ncbi:hypothetical protein CMMCA002_09255 [Clavibacter michiganensis subsp. michiganensis]|nr:hypothetical protein CMMCA002_09255 [Clavibacter michiganensis subsp. michiganensis]
MSAVTEARTDAVGGAQSWRGLIAQPVAIAAVLGAYLVWLAVAPLTAVERTTLEPAALGRSTLEHLVLTFSAAAIVLVIAVPLGVLLTADASAATPRPCSRSRTSARRHPRSGSSCC